MSVLDDEPHPLLPEWQVSAWLNTPQPLTLKGLRGKVVLLHTFQMLCPGCVAYGLPQAERARQLFPASELAVVGLHTVFEHHAVMNVAALRAFVHEYRWSFPIGVDDPDGQSGPSLTMARYGLRGTPSCIVLDRQGRVQLHHLGQIDDLALGARLGRLIGSPTLPRDAANPPRMRASEPHVQAPACTPEECSVQGNGG
ncbi:MAG: TlpA family protein disulfide reductase [Rubrivivax sp.]|jgi:hypothetical protein|nr:TlpA family protein disulfide reductase [Rubrivivax sp.]